VLHNGVVVAVKKMFESRMIDDIQFTAEINPRESYNNTQVALKSHSRDYCETRFREIQHLPSILSTHTKKVILYF